MPGTRNHPSLSWEYSWHSLEYYWNTFFPLNGASKEQACASHSTPEAEIVPANAAVRIEGLPALQLWDTISNGKVHATLLEDNQATMQILKSGKHSMMFRQRVPNYSMDKGRLEITRRSRVANRPETPSRRLECIAIVVQTYVYLTLLLCY